MKGVEPEDVRAPSLITAPPPLGLALGVGALIALLAFVNTAALRSGSDLRNLGSSQRYWEDVAVAFSRCEGVKPAAGPATGIEDPLGRAMTVRLSEALPREVERIGIQPWEFWRFVGVRYTGTIPVLSLRVSDDYGRARISSALFCLAGGIAPYFPIWLGFLALLPILLWIVYEFLAAGETAAGLAFAGMLTLSASLLEAVTLPYSAVGFHLLGGLALVPLTVFILSARPTLQGVCARAVAAALVIYPATWCRSSVIVFLPFVLVLLLMGLFRVSAGLPVARRRLLMGGLFLGLLAPIALLPEGKHAFWMGMWQGLGDFDREHGHVWTDEKAREALRSRGIPIEGVSLLISPEAERMFKTLVLRDIQNDPVWFAKILARRLGESLTQWRLWPRASKDGSAYRRADSAEEGAINEYYGLTKTADVLTFRGGLWEVPLPLLWLPVLIFAARGLARPTARWKRRAASVLVLAAASLLMPVLITTASAIETQAMVFVYFLCTAFCVSDFFDWAVSWFALHRR